MPSLHILFAVSLLAIGAEDVYNEHIRPMAASQAFAITPPSKTEHSILRIMSSRMRTLQIGDFFDAFLLMGVNQQCTRGSIDEVAARRREVRI